MSARQTIERDGRAKLQHAGRCTRSHVRIECAIGQQPAFAIAPEHVRRPLTGRREVELVVRIRGWHTQEKLAARVLPEFLRDTGLSEA